jgi:DUF1680 family protein
MTLHVDPAKPDSFGIRIRIPGWLNGKAVPGGLYHMNTANASKMPVFLVNGKPVSSVMRDGYACLSRKWMQGDRLTWTFEMPVQRLYARDEIKQTKGRTALQRGPLVYCVEGVDNDSAAWNIILPENVKFSPVPHSILNEKVMALRGTAPVLVASPDGISAKTELRTVTAIPYYAWANRGKTEMQVWLPTRIKDLKINY